MDQSHASFLDRLSCVLARNKNKHHPLWFWISGYIETWTARNRPYRGRGGGLARETLSPHLPYWAEFCLQTSSVVRGSINQSESVFCVFFLMTLGGSTNASFYARIEARVSHVDSWLVRNKLKINTGKPSYLFWMPAIAHARPLRPSKYPMNE